MSEHVANGCRCEEPPEPQPLDLAEVEDAYQVVFSKVADLGKSGQRLADAIPELLAELREAREQLAYWRSLPIREEYAITDGRHPDEAGVVWPGSSEDAQRLAQDPDRRPWVRSLTVHPWQDLTEAPF